MKILYVISTLGGGGAESQLCTYALELKKRHPEYDFEICAIKTGGVFEKKLFEAGISYTVLNSYSLPKSVVLVRKLIKDKRFDIIHAHMFLSDIVTRLATIGYNTKVVATHHGLGKWKTKPMLLLDRITQWRVDQFIMVSQQSYNIRLRRERYPANKMMVIYNGLSEDFVKTQSKSLPANGERIVIGTTARLTDNKQINLMIDVMKDLAAYPNLFYEVVGEGENFEKLINQTKRLGIESRVHFWGWQDDVTGIIENWHIFALPSINEDLPVAMMECMAQGIVPVASRVGGIITLLQNGENGILCDSGNRNTFTEGIIYLLEHPDEYARCSERCIKTIRENFLIQKTVEDTVAVYEKLRRN